MILTSCLWHYGHCFWQKLWILCQQYVGHEGAKPQKKKVFPLRAVKQLLVWSGSLWCVTGAGSSKHRPRGAPVCVYLCVCVHVLSELTSSICVLGVCGARGHSRVNSGRVNVERSGSSACFSLCTSATSSQLRNNTLHSLQPLWLHCSEENTHSGSLCCSFCCCWLFINAGDRRPCSGGRTHRELPRIGFRSEAYWLFSGHYMVSSFIIPKADTAAYIVWALEILWQHEFQLCKNHFDQFVRLKRFNLISLHFIIWCVSRIRGINCLT